MYHDNSGGQFLALFLTIYLVVIAAVVVIALVWYVLTALAFMRFFEKVGLPAWTAWVPFYNTWKLLEVGGQPGWISLLRLLGSAGGIVTLVFEIIGMHRIGIAFRKPTSWVVLGVFLPFVWAYLLGRPEEVYDPSLDTAAGYPPPLAGYGSVPRPPAGTTPPPPPTV